MFEFGEEALDAIALFVEVSVIGPLRLSVSLGRDNDIGSSLFDLVAQMISIIAFVSKNRLRFEAVDEIMRQSDVIALPRRPDQADRKTQRFCRMDLRAQSAARPTQALGIRPPFSLRAPAACWWARTMVLSIISHSRSASRASTNSIASRTPISIQR